MTLDEILADIKSDRKKKVILDTDTFNEIDDQYALSYCYLSDKIDLLSVTAAPFYNNNSKSYEDGMLKSYDEIKKVLSLLDENYKTPVFHGSRNTVTLSGDAVDSPAARHIIEAVKESDEIVYILGIGCITNVTSAIMLDPSIKDNMCVIWLGGNGIYGDNLEEFNLTQDYKAGQILINCGVPLLLCPAWCVVSELTANIGMVRELKGLNPICDYLFKISEKIQIESEMGEDWVRIVWDIAAPAILDMPECAEIEIITAPVFADDRKYAYDSTRHKMLYLKKLCRDKIFEKTWNLLKNA